MPEFAEGRHIELRILVVLKDGSHSMFRKAVQFGNSHLISPSDL
jgi:hypothetical protein